MWTLAKGVFWFSMVLVTIPFFDAGTRERLADAPPVAVGDSVTAAFTALEDIRGICARNPGVCETGSETVAALGMRAREGARIAYEFLDDRFAAAPASGPDLTTTASVPPPAPPSVPVPVPAPAPRP